MNANNNVKFLNNNELIIAGKIGNKEIAKENLNTFLSSIKDFEWTDNNIYKPAKVVEVRPSFIYKQNIDNSALQIQPRNLNFDNFYVEDNKHLVDFCDYKSDMENRITKLQDGIMNKKREFINKFFPNENLSENPEKKEILNIIKNNKSKIIMSNRSLAEKLERHMSYLSSQ